MCGTSGEKWLNSGFILKVETPEFDHTKVFCLNNWKNRDTIYQDGKDYQELSFRVVFFEVPVSIHMETLNKQLNMHIYSSKNGQD